MPKVNHGLNFTYILLSGAGYLFTLVAALYNETLLGLLETDPAGHDVVDKIQRVRLDFLVIGLVLVFIAALIRKLSTQFVRFAWLQKPLTTNILLSLLTFAIPITVLELAFKPFVSTEATTIFMRDEALGWRLRPNTIGTWGGVPVKINAKGLRGPEVAYTKPADTFRILYLGDSVTFGFLLFHDEETFPYQVEMVLEERLNQENVETVNAGVGGYSPWQHYRYLAGEGLRYAPDLVGVGFVLNDVTEKFDLFRFGGSEEGYQLEHTAFSNFDHWASRSSILYVGKQLGARLRFSRQVSDIRQAAIVQEALKVEMLAYEPEHPDVRAAWQLTLDNLGQIFTLAQGRDIPVALVVFPFTFQFEDVEDVEDVIALSTPQTIVSQYARNQGVPVLDLLPLLAQTIAQAGLTPSTYFLDRDHLSPLGSEVVAIMIADFLQQEGLVRH